MNRLTSVHLEQCFLQILGGGGGAVDEKRTFRFSFQRVFCLPPENEKGQVPRLNLSSSSVFFLHSLSVLSYLFTSVYISLMKSRENTSRGTRIIMLVSQCTYTLGCGVRTLRQKCLRDLSVFPGPGRHRRHANRQLSIDQPLFLCLRQISSQPKMPFPGPEKFRFPFVILSTSPTRHLLSTSAVLSLKPASKGKEQEGAEVRLGTFLSLSLCRVTPNGRERSERQREKRGGLHGNDDSVQPCFVFRTRRRLLAFPYCL